MTISKKRKRPNFPIKISEKRFFRLKNEKLNSLNNKYLCYVSLDKNKQNMTNKNQFEFVFFKLNQKTKEHAQKSNIQRKTLFKE